MVAKKTEEKKRKLTIISTVFLFSFLFLFLILFIYLLQHAIPLSQQLEYYKEYRVKLAKVAGSKRAAAILKGALYLVGFGTADFLQNYYVNPSLKKLYTPDQYSTYLATIFSSFIKVS